MIIPCRWITGDYGTRDYDACPSPSTEIIVYGCLNQHIGEAPLCNFHAGIWIKSQSQQKIRCATCKQPIDYWNACETHRAQVGYYISYIAQFDMETR
jgi:hypothetical protein